MRRLVPALCLLALCTVLADPVLASGGSKQPEPPELGEAKKTPEEMAVEAYNRGIGMRDKAWKLQDKVAETTDAKARAKLEKKIERNYQGAARQFEQAIENNPRMFQAHSDLGYCKRKLGDFEGSLASYDRALAIEPRYGEAIEYRGQTYLVLGRLDEAKQAYMQLFGGARPLADKLLVAMQTWVGDQRENGGGTVDGAALAAFADWVDERSEIAGQTKSISELRHHDW